MDTHSPALAARSAAPTGAAFARPMTPDEAAHLDRLREWLRGDGTDATDASALDARWARLLATHPPQAPAPAGVAAAIGIAVGDLLVASVTDAVWRMCPGPEGATPGVLLPERPQMPVLPVLDAHARWRVRSPEWTVDYVERAAAHLRRLRPAVPTPHPAPEAAPAAPVDDAAPAVRTTPEPAAWAPRFVEDTTEPEAQPEPETTAWTPTFVEDTTEPEPAAWTPTFVEDTTQPEAAAWTPTFVEDTAEHAVATEDTTDPEPATWTPTFVEDTTEPEAPADAEAWTPALVEDTTQPEAAAWTPTFVEDTAEHEVATEDTTDPEPAAWTPTFVEDTTEPEASTWSATQVEGSAGSDVEAPTSGAAAVEETPEPEPAWAPELVEPTDLDVEAHHDALAAPLTGAVAVVPEPAAWAPTSVEEPAAPEPSVTPWDASPVATAYPTPGRGMPVVPEHTLTPEDLPHRPSERVQDLALRALELALDRAVRDVAGCAPFVLVREGYDVEVQEFPRSDEGVALARAAARDGGYTAAAVAWTSPADASRPYPRVVVDASAAGRPGIRVAHSFLHDEQGGHEIGGPQVVGQSAPVL